ncbi:MAG: ATP-dependent helicase [Deltaproteobacteria bacterium]|nr:ATP-dependent helicase [Deltaproteobacteria bacterium]
MEIAAQPGLRELRRALREERRPVRPGDDREAPPEAPIAAPLAARLAEVRDACPRLHARMIALDPAQQAAVLDDAPAALVRAQVGSGKTTVLVHKALYLHLVRGVPLDQIAVVTFTTRAADELRARLEELAERPVAPDERWLMGTFHGVACTLLHRALPIEHLGYRPDFAVLDDDASDALVAALVRGHKLRVPRRQLRERLRAVVADPAGDELARLAALARDARRAQNAMDFDELIDHASALLAAGGPPRPRWLLVDELQDCEPRELGFLRQLRGPDTRFFGVGDPLQAIYGWRGSAPALFAHAETELGCRAAELPTSYRSTRTILEAARAVLGAQPSGTGALTSARAAGAPIAIRRHHDPIGEAVYLAARLAELHAGGVPHRELAVLCRLRAQFEVIAAVLGSRGIPLAMADDAQAEGVRLLTLHAAKGLEFRHVFIAGANVGVVPLVQRGDTGDPAEERRLLFVGITRARDGVEISYHASPHQHGASGGPSPLLALIPPELVALHEAAPRPPAASILDAPRRAAPIAAIPAPSSSPWTVGQAVRHPRYGAGVITALAADTIDCDFGKLGPRSFPRRRCPLLP